jgi:peptide chain release factor 1
MLPREAKTPSSWWEISFLSIVRWQSGGVFEVELIDSRPGLTIFQVSGAGSSEAFANEPGGHRFQRVPITERNGRVQTSTITVAVLPDIEESVLHIPPGDLEWSMTTARGNGGQSVNTTYSCVILKHKPSGLTVRCQNERSQLQNKRFALEILRSRLMSQKEEAEHSSRSMDRKNQLGQGQRGDKRRTIRVRDNSVKDHITGKTWRYADYVSGNW